MKTKVIFRQWKNGDILALFPYEPYNHLADGYCQSYEHVGQHGPAYYSGCVMATKLADYDSQPVKDMIQELERIGYDLEIRKRKHR